MGTRNHGGWKVSIMTKDGTAKAIMPGTAVEDDMDPDWAKRNDEMLKTYGIKPVAAKPKQEPKG